MTAINEAKFYLFLLIAGTSAFCANVPIPVYFFPYTDLPVIEIEIEGKKHLLELDTGCDALVLQAPLLENYTKLGPIKTSDIRGNIYSSFEYLVPNVRMQSLEFKDIVARQENLNLLAEGCVVSPATHATTDRLTERLQHIKGRIGWDLLKEGKWYFNFSKALLLRVDDIKDLGDRFISTNSRQVPLEVSEIGLLLCLDTDLGQKRFLLDTGANHLFLRQSLVDREKAKQAGPGKYIYLSHLGINGLSLGNYPFFLFDCPPLYDNIDGVLGIQFFECNDIYLDFKNKCAIIGPKQEGFWAGLITRVREFFYWCHYKLF